MKKLFIICTFFLIVGSTILSCTYNSKSKDYTDDTSTNIMAESIKFDDFISLFKTVQLPYLFDLKSEVKIPLEFCSEFIINKPPKQIMVDSLVNNYNFLQEAKSGNLIAGALISKSDKFIVLELIGKSRYLCTFFSTGESIQVIDAKCIINSDTKCQEMEWNAKISTDLLLDIDFKLVRENIVKPEENSTENKYINLLINSDGKITTYELPTFLD